MVVKKYPAALVPALAKNRQDSPSEGYSVEHGDLDHVKIVRATLTPCDPRPEASKEVAEELDGLHPTKRRQVVTGYGGRMNAQCN